MGDSRGEAFSGTNRAGRARTIDSLLALPGLCLPRLNAFGAARCCDDIQVTGTSIENCFNSDRPDIADGKWDEIFHLSAYMTNT